METIPLNTKLARKGGTKDMNDLINREFEQVDLVQKLPPEKAVMAEAKATNFFHLFMLLTIAGAFLGGIEGAFGLSRSTSRWLLCTDILVMNAISYFLFIIDAKANDYEPSSALKFAVVAIGFPALLYYFLKSRRVKGCLTFVGAFLIMVLSYDVVRVFTRAIVKAAVTYTHSVIS